MTPAETNPTPVFTSYEDLSRSVDFAIVGPEASDDRIAQTCEQAKARRVGRLTVRPSSLDLVTRWMGGSGISICAAVSYPHGADTTAVKLYAVRDAINRGARAIETILSPGRMISRQFRHLESEIMQMTQECHRSGVEFILDFEIGWLPPDLQAIACKLARRTEVDVVRAASLYGPPASAEDVQLLVSKLGELAKVSTTLPETLEAAEAARVAGVAWFQTAAPEPLLTAWDVEVKRRADELAAG
ncbi:MAG: hypothetical protein JSU00_12965 [Acidobacteria bacterium]|nr:hypothetical protein [Acidobacteriota bacterium]